MENKELITNSPQPINEVQTFENLTLGNVRVVIIDNEPHFCLRDLAIALDFRDASDLKRALAREFDKGDGFNTYPLETSGGKQNFIFVNESEMYFVLMRSKSEKAKPFRQWVTKEVLPTIRKTGSYSTQHKMPQTFIEALEEYLISLKAQEQLKLELQEKETLLIESQEANNEKQDRLDDYSLIESNYRKKQELKASFNKRVREYAQKSGLGFAKAYGAIYNIFANSHCISQKVNMAYIETNNDYLSECLAIVLNKINELN